MISGVNLLSIGEVRLIVFYVAIMAIMASILFEYILEE
jgi:hypothetical protein